MNSQVAQALTHPHDWLQQPCLQWLNIALFIVASGFWIEAHYTAEAFDARIYGDFALMFPAQAWAAMMMGGAALTFVGLVRPVHRWKVVIGSAIQAAQFTALAYSAIMTGGEIVIGLFASVVFAPMFLKLAYEAWTNDGG